MFPLETPTLDIPSHKKKSHVCALINSYSCLSLWIISAQVSNMSVKMPPYNFRAQVCKLLPAIWNFLMDAPEKVNKPSLLCFANSWLTESLSMTWFLFCAMLLFFSRSVVSDSLWPHGLQHARFLCPSLSPGVYSDSRPLNQWCYLTITSSATLLLLP